MFVTANHMGVTPIVEAVRRHLGLDLLDRLWAKDDLDEQHAAGLAVEAQHATRRKRRR